MFGLFKNKHKEENLALMSKIAILESDLSNEKLEAALYTKAYEEMKDRAYALEDIVAELKRSLAEASLEIEAHLDLIRVLETPASKKRKVSKKAKSKR